MQSVMGLQQHCCHEKSNMAQHCNWPAAQHCNWPAAAPDRRRMCVVACTQLPKEASYGCMRTLLYVSSDGTSTICAVVSSCS